MDVEPHVGGNVANGGIQVRVGIVKEPCKCVPGFGSGSGLFGQEVAKGH